MYSKEKWLVFEIYHIFPYILCNVTQKLETRLSPLFAEQHYDEFLSIILIIIVKFLSVLPI